MDSWNLRRVYDRVRQEPMIADTVAPTIDGAGEQTTKGSLTKDEDSPSKRGANDGGTVSVENKMLWATV